MSWKDMAEEVAHHLRDQYAELRAAGYSHQEAMKTNASEIADVNPGDWRRAGGGLWQDLRFGARLLVKDRGASAVVVLTLALAIAANGIVFGFADLLLLRPLPMGNAHRLVAIFGVDHQQGQDRQRLSLPDYRDVVAHSTVFEDVAAMRRGQQLSLTGAGDPVAVSAAFVTANVFRTWGVPAVVGRTMLPEEGTAGRNAVAALSHRFWKSHFAGNPSIVGRAILLNGRSYAVVGVITPDIELGNLSEIDLWVPFEAQGIERRDERAATVFGLLKPGATLATANTELATIGDRLARAYPATNGTWTLFAITLRESIAGSTTWIILALLGLVVGLVLIVACANVATVMLARASARRREIAVRVALGATRRRLVRQLVSEGLLIGVASGVVGLFVTYAGLTAFRTLSPEVFFERLSINANLLTFAIALSIAAPILFGVMPALQASRPNLNEDLKDGGRDSSASVRGNRSRSVLVIAQVGFALAVMIVSGLIVRTVIGLERVPLGMNPEGLLTTRVRFDPPNYADDGARLRAIESILERLSAAAGVTAATAVRSLPIVEAEPRRQFTIAGRAAVPASSAPWAMEASTLGDYGRAIGLPLRDGRVWMPSDRASSWSVALVNREAVRRYWPERSPVGDRITMIDATGRPDGGAIEIIGIVDNVIGPELSEPAPPRIYRPLPSAPSLASVAFAIRIAGDPAAAAPAIREALRAEDSSLAVSELRPARRELDETTRTSRLIMSLFVGFAAIGLVVAVAGVYGVTAFSVGQRRHEIGVRLALGATAADVVRLVAGRTVRLIAIGAALGMAGGWAIGVAIRNILFGVGAADPLTYAAVVALVGTCGFAAAYLPTRRAISIDPVSVLKRE
jgi:putative ABC transport system permease protein